ncbi:MAG TPA: hypothetical protein VGJ95_22470 [Pseudonocardiaceae bacterium]
MRLLVAAALVVLGLGAAAPTGVEVTVQPRQAAATIGDRFTVQARVTNTGPAATGPLIAHVDVVGLTSDMTVDPEDWSASRTERLEPLAPGEGITMDWEFQAVNVGRFEVYVVVLPDGPDGPGGPDGRLAISPAVHLAVAGRPTLNAGGALPVVLAVPLLLGLAAGGVRLRLRRTL